VPGGIRTSPAGLPRLPAPTYRMEAGGRQCGVRVIVGRHRGEFVAQDAGLGRPEHPASDSS
jgi:hypothetical protein